METEGYYYVHERQPLVPKPSQMNSVYMLSTHIF
jgi:hypothetical protein